MLQAGSVFSTATGGDLIMPTVNDTTNKATIVAEYQKSTQKSPAFGSETMKAYTYRTPIVPVSQELLQDSSFDLEALLADLIKSVDSNYANNGRFMFNHNTLWSLMKLKGTPKTDSNVRFDS